jgi:WhiB family redox-sensing transcriptional regulator
VSAHREHRRRVLARWADSLNGAWRRRAACNPATGVAPDPSRIPAFFSLEDADTVFDLQKQREAALFCNTACPVQAECLQFALNVDEEYGVWGGTTETERRLLARKVRKGRQPV